MTELDLLKWVAEGEPAQYGECHGRILDALIAKGEVEVRNGREHQTPFIAKGDDLMYQAVFLTDKGRARLRPAP